MKTFQHQISQRNLTLKQKERKDSIKLVLKIVLLRKPLITTARSPKIQIIKISSLTTDRLNKRGLSVN